ncbi:methionine--tRNA ligase [Photobacterium atrarenae]|uniref:methionine--tRNA ligase n=1 Tax=Photobacterium atrarenae TaxID=865757 RepID=A0ABY5GM97_9GAMM|nr:methionine--tRNA ligase [Photobacterium atrarenae]UTV30271.1 methionine--tRNA ligase [Photobacterium atrarenae]
MTSFVTTPIFYANGKPHLGHAYSGIVADICHRFSQLTGEENVLITGTDEHGQKIASTAQAAATDIATFVDVKAETFAALWPELTIQPDIFIRTTQSAHKAHVREVWQQLFERGDIYLGSYSGQYCVACEQYYSPRELEDEHCPVHKKPVVTVAEETYLFRLENYRQQLLDYYLAHPDLITPSHFQESIMALLREGPLEDLSVSRINNSWGVQVPNHSEHTVYVWIDALFSYITAIQQSGHANTAIANTAHILGKDILKFHALYWPAFLLALDLPLPKKLVVHGWWTIEGQKISKSNPQTTVNPSTFSHQLTADGLRYALVRQKPLYRDGNVAIGELAEVINADLANNFANLVKRNNTLILKYFDGQLDDNLSQDLDAECEQLLSTSRAQLAQVIGHYQDYDIYQVTLVLKQLLDQLNTFFHHRAPWLISKGQDRRQTINTCFVIANVLQQVALSYLPIVPQLSQRVLTEFGIDETQWRLNPNLPLHTIEIQESNSHFARIQLNR